MVILPAFINTDALFSGYGPGFGIAFAALSPFFCHPDFKRFVLMPFGQKRVKRFGIPIAFRDSTHSFCCDFNQ
ncbi:hypothetical protein KCP78_01095 [Salmonella enterica subsp. enterica]|nr:hypothetical protein KCP78_01095 [Salmonella enterica subsp. enterica]